MKLYLHCHNNLSFPFLEPTVAIILVSIFVFCTTWWSQIPAEASCNKYDNKKFWLWLMVLYYTELLVSLLFYSLPKLSILFLLLTTEVENIQYLWQNEMRVMPLRVTLFRQFLHHYYGFLPCFSPDWESSEYIFIYYFFFIFFNSKYRRKVGWGSKYLCHPLTYVPVAMTGTPYWTEE